MRCRRVEVGANEKGSILLGDRLDGSVQVL